MLRDMLYTAWLRAPSPLPIPTPETRRSQKSFPFGPKCGGSMEFEWSGFLIREETAGIS